MKYPVNIERDGSNLFVSFPDIPEALTCGDTLDDALFMAQDALLTALTCYFRNEERIPLPGDHDTGYSVALPPSVTAKILLLNAMVDSAISKAELARRVHIKRQNVNKLLDIRHQTKIDKIDEAAKALGKDLLISLC